MKVKMRMKRMMGFFLALVMSIGCLSLNPTVSYANDSANDSVANGGVKIDESHFPDEHFRIYVKQYDTDRNGYLSKKELDDVKIIDLPRSVSSLKGIEYFKNLTSLDCSCMRLTSLDLSKNIKLTRLDCGDQQYYITVDKRTRQFKYSEFPGGFEREKVTSPVGADFGADALTVNSGASEVTYNYKVDNNRIMNVRLNVTYFDPTQLVDMKVKKQPTKRTYTEGDKLDLTGLVVTLTDNPGATIDVPFTDADFDNYEITTDPKNGAPLIVDVNNRKAVKLTLNSRTVLLTTQTSLLTVMKFDPTRVVDMKVTTQPKKLSYTDGDKLDLAGLVVTLKDAQGLTRDVPFADAYFVAYKITATPENGKELTVDANNGKKVTLTRGNLTAETDVLKVKAKESSPEHVESSGSTSGSGVGMNDNAPTTVDKGELNIQISSVEGDSKPGNAGDGAAASLPAEQKTGVKGDLLPQTGSDVTQSALIASLLASVGFAGFVAKHRRKRKDGKNN